MKPAQTFLIQAQHSANLLTATEPHRHVGLILFFLECIEANMIDQDSNFPDPDVSYKATFEANMKALIDNLTQRLDQDNW